MLIDKLDIPRRWKNRLKRYYWNENYFNELLKRLETNSDIDPVFVETDKSRYQKMKKEDQNKRSIPQFSCFRFSGERDNDYRGRG